MQNNNVTYFYSFGVEHIPKEIKAFIITTTNNNNNKNIKTNIFRIQVYNLFSLNNFKKNDSTILNYFMSNI